MRKINPKSISNFKKKGIFSIMILFISIVVAILFFSKCLKSGFEYELNGILGMGTKFRNLNSHPPTKYSIFFASSFPGYL